MAVEASGLFIMVSLAERLKIVQIVLELLVSTEGFDVVDHSRLRILPFFQTFHTERMSCEVHPSKLLPAFIITSAVCRTHIFRMHLLVFLTILGTTLNELTTSRFGTRVFSFPRHLFHLPSKNKSMVTTACLPLSLVCLYPLATFDLIHIR